MFKKLCILQGIAAKDVHHELLLRNMRNHDNCGEWCYSTVMLNYENDAGGKDLDTY